MKHVVLGCSPTDNEIVSAKLYLEFYGGTINNIMQESKPIKDNYVRDSDVINKISAFMVAEGWEFSGSGFFSAVYVKGGLAIKVGLKKEDSGATYAAWCRANQGKPGVPVIYAIDKFTKVYVVLMDRCYTWQAGYNSHIDCEASMVKDVIQYGDQAYAEMPVTCTAREIHEFFTGIAFFDCNSGNLMLDRFGGLVITDPVSFDHARRSASNKRPAGKVYSYECYTY